jgi:3-hydroxyisobutyrate dehydrogenase-like beta-hydroxyacid dehydrogenase
VDTVQIRNIGVMSPGDMGQAIAGRLQEAGFAVHTALAGRSQRTKALADEIGLHDCGSLEHLVETCDLLISLINPGHAVAFAGDVASAIRATGRPLIVADLNAIAPGTAREAELLIRAAGGRFIDGGVLGLPPRGEGSVRIVASGPDAAVFEQIRHPSLRIRILSDRVGDASAVKLCNAAMTKGVTALTVELLIAARRLGVEDVILSELRTSRSDVLDWQLRAIPGMPSKADRWVPEMHEVARMFDEVGLGSAIFEGVADVYGRVSASPLAHESPEAARHAARDGLAVVHALADEDRA